MMYDMQVLQVDFFLYYGLDQKYNRSDVIRDYGALFRRGRKQTLCCLDIESTKLAKSEYIFLEQWRSNELCNPIYNSLEIVNEAYCTKMQKFFICCLNWQKKGCLRNGSESSSYCWCRRCIAMSSAHPSFLAISVAPLLVRSFRDGNPDFLYGVKTRLKYLCTEERVWCCPFLLMSEIIGMWYACKSLLSKVMWSITIFVSQRWYSYFYFQGSQRRWKYLWMARRVVRVGTYIDLMLRCKSSFGVGSISKLYPVGSYVASEDGVGYVLLRRAWYMVFPGAVVVGAVSCPTLIWFSLCAFHILEKISVHKSCSSFDCKSVNGRRSTKVKCWGESIASPVGANANLNN